MVKCGICSRTFKTQGAMLQHKKDAHGGSQQQPKAAKQPKKRSGNASSLSSGNMMGEISFPIRRREYFFAVSVPSSGGEVSGWCDFSLRDGDSSEKGLPVLRKLAGNFQKWKLRAAKIDYVPATSAMANGQVCLGVDHDSATGAPKTKPGVLSMPSVSTSVFRATSLVIKCDGGAERFTKIENKARDVPFSIRWYAMVDPQGGANKERLLGDVWLTYDLTLYGVDTN